MRKSDMEMLEMRLEPLQTARDRHNETINTLGRQLADLTTQVKDLVRDGQAHDLTIKQGLASVRSLLQRAHRLERSQADEDAERLDDPEPAVNVAPTRDDIIRAARSRHAGRRML